MRGINYDVGMQDFTLAVMCSVECSLFAARPLKSCNYDFIQVAVCGMLPKKTGKFCKQLISIIAYHIIAEKNSKE